MLNIFLNTLSITYKFNSLYLSGPPHASSGTVAPDAFWTPSPHHQTFIKKSEQTHSLDEKLPVPGKEN